MKCLKIVHLLSFTSLFNRWSYGSPRFMFSPILFISPWIQLHFSVCFSSVRFIPQKYNYNLLESSILLSPKFCICFCWRSSFMSARLIGYKGSGVPVHFSIWECIVTPPHTSFETNWPWEITLSKKSKQTPQISLVIQRGKCVESFRGLRTLYFVSESSVNSKQSKKS